MPQRNRPTRMDGSTVEHVAHRLGCGDVSDVARAAAEHAQETITREFDPETTTVAAVRLASRRGGRDTLELEPACRALDVRPTDVTRAESALEATLQPPADAETIRSLRRTVITVRELLVAVELGRKNAPYRPSSPLEGLDPALTALLEQPLDRIDAETLRRHLRRLEADLEMTRLGVDLYALVYDGDTGGADAGGHVDGDGGADR